MTSTVIIITGIIAGIIFATIDIMSYQVCVDVSTDRYMHSEPRRINVPKQMHRRGAIYAMHEIPCSHRKALYVIDQTKDFEKNNLYLLADDHGRYRLARCVATAKNMPPIFDQSETFVTHKYMGGVVAIYDWDSGEELSNI